MIGDADKLSVYFGDSLSAGVLMSSDALMAALAERGARLAVLKRGIEGFGVNRRIHAERFPDISTDLPLLATIVDPGVRVEALLEAVDASVPRGLVTREHVRMATGADVARARFPTDGAGRAAKLTVFCGRGQKVRGALAFRAVVDVLRGQGATGAIVLLGVDGVLDGRRTKARLFAPNADTPVMLISVGPTEVLERALPALGALRDDLVVTLERIAQVKHDGALLEAPPRSVSAEEPDVWHTLRVYTRQSAQVDGRALHSELIRRLRAAGAAGATTILGVWGFSSDEHPYGDRLGRIASHLPSYTVYIDRPRKVAEAWPIVDELTAEHGIVTWLAVPGYRERAEGLVAGDLRIGKRATSTVR